MDQVPHIILGSKVVLLTVLLKSVNVCVLHPSLFLQTNLNHCTIQHNLRLLLKREPGTFPWVWQVRERCRQSCVRISRIGYHMMLHIRIEVALTELWGELRTGRAGGACQD